jgi:hypothetical protein
MIERLGFALTLAVAACGGRPTPAPAVAPAQGPAILTLGEMRLIEVASNATLVFRANGDLQVDGSTKATVTATGKVLARNGEPIFELQRDGKIKDLAYDKLLAASVGDDGSVTVLSTRFSISDSGELIGRDPNASPIRIEGATSIGLKRTAMFVFVVLMVAGDKPDAE